MQLRILAIYTQPTLSLLRRIQAPYSVLHNRGNNFSFINTPVFSPDYATSYDVTVLPNWILGDAELEALAAKAQHHAFVYDLSDPDLLMHPSVQEALRLSRLVTVPNVYLAKEVRNLLGTTTRVAVTPSVVDVPFMMAVGQLPVQDGPKVVSCVGPFDWELCKDALVEFHDEHPQVRFAGDAHACAVLGEFVMEMATIDVMEYPTIFRMSAVGLLPQEKETGRDLIWEHEYGIFGTPTIAVAPPLRSSSSVDREKRAEIIKGQWKKRLSRLLFEKQAYSEASLAAREEAKKWTATRLADQYLKVYRENLPALLKVR